MEPQTAKSARAAGRAYRIANGSATFAATETAAYTYAMTTARDDITGAVAHFMAGAAMAAFT